MTAAPTAIPDVSPVRPPAATSTAPTASAPAVDFGMIVALLQRAAVPAPATAATAPAAIPAVEGAVAAMAADAPASGVPAVAWAPAVTGELESHPITEPGTSDEVSTTVAAGETTTRTRGVPAADDATTDEPSASTDAPVVIAMSAAALVIPAFVPVAPAPVPAAASTGESATDASPASPARALESSPSRTDVSSRPLTPEPPVAAAATSGVIAPAVPADTAPAPSAITMALASDARSDGTPGQEGGEPATGATPATRPDQPGTARSRADAGAVARTPTPWRAGAEGTRATREPGASAAVGAPARDTAARSPIAAAAVDPESPVTSARDAATRQAPSTGAARAVAPPREPAAATPSGLAPVRSSTILDGAPSHDAAPAAPRELVPGVHRVRSDSTRDGAARDAASVRAPERGGQDAAAPSEAGAVSFDAWMSPSRVIAADRTTPMEEARAPVVEQVVARVRELRTDGRHEITMRLDPPDLGGVTIDARLEGARLTVHIRAEHGATQELLADALPRLRESLAQQGFVPDQVSVQLGFDGAGGGAAGGDTARDGARPFQAPLPVSPTPAPTRAPRVSVPASAPGPRAGLDVWA